MYIHRHYGGAGRLCTWNMPYLTEEHEHAHVQLQQARHAQCPPLVGAQRVEEQLAAQRALALLGPHVDLLLAVGEGAVLPVLALLTLLHLCGHGRQRTQDREKGRRKDEEREKKRDKRRTKYRPNLQCSQVLLSRVESSGVTGLFWENGNGLIAILMAVMRKANQYFSKKKKILICFLRFCM